MTTRENLNRARRRGLYIGGIGFVLFAGAICADRAYQGNLALLGGLLFTASLLCLTLTGRCVHCGKLLGRMFSTSADSLIKIASALQFCPYCGTPLDDPKT